MAPSLVSEKTAVVTDVNVESVGRNHLKFLEIIELMITVECRNPKARNPNNVESQTNAGSVIRHSDFGYLGRSVRFVLDILASLDRCVYIKPKSECSN